MINTELREAISSYCNDTVLFDNPSFDNSIVGMTISGNIIYDMNKMIEELMEDDHMTSEEAIDFIQYNTLRALPYIKEYRPIILEITIEELKNKSK